MSKRRKTDTLKKRAVKFVIFLTSFGLFLALVDRLLSFTNVNANFDQLFFADTYKVNKQNRLFFPDENRLYKLVNRGPNSNIYPSYTQRETWTVDEQGFRPDVRSNTDLGSDVFTILMLGDSFTYGQGMSHWQTYPSYVEQELLSRNKNVNVINAGVPSYGPDQQLAYLEELVPKIKPQLIVWNVYQNDLTDANYFCLYTYDTEHGLQKLAAWRNNVYRQGWLADNLPDPLAGSTLVRLLAHIIGYPYGGDNYISIATWGCTRPIDVNWRAHLVQKVDAMYQKGIQIARAHQAQVVFIMMPTQRMFQYPHDFEDEVVFIDELSKLKTFRTSPFTDLNQVFNYMYLNSDQRAAKLAFNFSSQSDPRQQCINVYEALFNSAETEPDSYSRHLNAAGNYIVSQLVINFLAQTENFSVVSTK